MAKKILKAFLTILIISLITFAGYTALNVPDQRSAGEKISDALNAVYDGKDNPERQLQERTPGKKLKDAVKDVSEDIKE